MVYRRRARKSNRPIRRKLARYARSALRSVVRFNPNPVFTESYALQNGPNPYYMEPNSGGVLAVNIAQVPQLAQYSQLYQKYRILKAKFICIPAFNTASSDVNAQLPPGGMLSSGLSRVVYAINNSPNQVVLPVSENVVLEDNGCKIVCGSPKLTMSCRPVPDTNDAAGNKMTFTGKYLNFNPGVDIAHYGISWWHSQPVNPSGQGFGVPYMVYVKLTFQLSDPR